MVATTSACFHCVRQAALKAAVSRSAEGSMKGMRAKLPK